MAAAREELIVGTQKVDVMKLRAFVAGAAEVRVLCSTGMSSVMSVLVHEFERSSGHKLSIAYDTANLLMGRIFAGAKQAEAAQALVKFLSTPAAARVLKAKGMEPG